jgi:hypothetical protein
MQVRSGCAGDEPAYGDGPVGGRMNNKELKSAYIRRLKAITKILYDLDPDGIGRSIDAPLDEYSDAAAELMPRLWAARTESEASIEIRKSFPGRMPSLIGCRPIP